MLVHGMTFAFGGAGAAESDAGGELRFVQLTMPRLVRARDDIAGGVAGGSAIEIEPDAGDELFDMAFRKAGIGAGGAGLYAGETGVDAAAQHVGMARAFRMGTQHGADGGHGRPPSLADLVEGLSLPNRREPVLVP